MCFTQTSLSRNQQQQVTFRLDNMAAAPPQKELLYDVLDDGEEALVLKKPDVESGGGAGGKVKPKELNVSCFNSTKN